MLHNVKELYNYVLEAEDGEIGRCKDFLFDDSFWTIRYMVADTGNWLPGQKVLISPVSLGKPDWDSNLFPVWLTKKQIKDAPGLDEHLPVSRQYEIKSNKYYKWPYYWSEHETESKGSLPYPLSMEKRLADRKNKIETGDSHLRSTIEVAGYYIHAEDGEIGHVEDFIVNDKDWSIRHMVLDTRNWLPGRKVLVTQASIESVDWGEKKVSISLTREQVKNSPEYDPSALVNREHERRL